MVIDTALKRWESRSLAVIDTLEQQVAHHSFAAEQEYRLVVDRC